MIKNQPNRRVIRLVRRVFLSRCTSLAFDLNDRVKYLIIINVLRGELLIRENG